MKPNPYFQPPENLNYDTFSPLIQLGLGTVVVIGGLVIVITIYNAIKHALKVITGKGKDEASLDGKFFLWLFIGLFIGLLLLGGGWIGIVNLIHRTIVEPGQEIVYESYIYDI